MKLKNSWLYRPFKPYREFGKTLCPYISRIVPDSGSFECEWIDNGSDVDHTITVRKIGDEKIVRELSPAPHRVKITGLEDLTDYEVTLSRNDSSDSIKRLVRTGKMPGDSLPDIFEQKEIVEKTTKILEKEKQSKEAAEQVIDQIDAMKKSILTRAFRGGLGTNDPNDESAVELLKRALTEGI